MRKTLLRITVGAAAAAAAVMSSGVAQAETVNQAPTLDAFNDQWNDAGGHVGYGAASLVSAAVLGVPSAVDFYVSDVTGLTDVEYVADGE
jgi:hypothetical protein